MFKNRADEKRAQRDLDGMGALDRRDEGGTVAGLRKPYNNIVRVGIWVTVAAGLVWAGGETYKQIQNYVPWALGIGIAILVLGLIYEFRKKHSK